MGEALRDKLWLWAGNLQLCCRGVGESWSPVVWALVWGKDIPVSCCCISTDYSCWSFVIRSSVSLASCGIYVGLDFFLRLCCVSTSKASQSRKDWPRIKGELFVTTSIHLVWQLWISQSSVWAVWFVKKIKKKEIRIGTNVNFMFQLPINNTAEVELVQANCTCCLTVQFLLKWNKEVHWPVRCKTGRQHTRKLDTNTGSNSIASQSAE